LDNRPCALDPSASSDLRKWATILARYREPNHARSIVKVAITLGPLIALWVLAWVPYDFGFWRLSLLIAIPAVASSYACS